MPRFHKPDPEVYDPEPRWPAFIAALAVAGLYAALPSQLIVGPRWLLPLIIIALVIPTEITHARNLHSMNRVLGFAVSAVITVAMIISVVLLISALPQHLETPTQLLVSAACLWATNILVFTRWYWRLDAGGPHSRDKRPAHTDGAFLFPQMTMHVRRREKGRRRRQVVAQLFRLSVSRLQHEHRVLADRRSGACPLGKTTHDGPIDHILDRFGLARGKGREHPLTTIVRKAIHTIQSPGPRIVNQN